MEAIQFNAQTKQLQLVQKEIPKTIDDNQILVQVHYAGVCGTDIHIIDGEFPCNKERPFTLGHEFSGIVAKIGKNITHVKVGDQVVTDPNKGCMVCKNCHRGSVNYCETGGLKSTIGIFIDGGWQQYVIVSNGQIYKIPKGLTLEQASLTEPMSCISHAWDRVAPVPIGTRILILGSGIIGNLFSCLLHVQGFRKVTISEPSEGRRNLTKRLETGFDIITPDILQERQTKNPEYTFDLIIDACGNAKAIEHAITLLDFGGRLLLFGVSNPDHTLGIAPYKVMTKELSIIGALINPFSFHKAMDFLESMGNRYVDFDKLGVKVFQLKDFNEAIASLRQGKIAKATFKIEHRK